MFSRRMGQAAVLILAAGIGALPLSGCGKLGEKLEAAKILDYKSAQAGCLNEIGPRFEKYLAGEIEAAVWEGTWDCIIDSLELFQRFAKGSSSDDSFTQNDIRLFVSKFLLTSKPVTLRFIRSAFELKASLMGGSRETIARAELLRTLHFFRHLKETSTTLLPELRKFRHEPDPASLQQVSQSIQSFAVSLSSYLGNEANLSFPRSAIQSLVEELGQILDWKVSDQFYKGFMAGKYILIGGRLDEISSREWKTLIEASGRFGGPLLGVSKMVQNQRPFQEIYGLFGEELRAHLTWVFSHHGDSIPLFAFDEVLDYMPESWLKLNRQVLKRALRPAVGKLLRSRTQEALDRSSIDLLCNLLGQWSRLESHIDEIYHILGNPDPGASLEQLRQAVTQYSARLDEQGIQDMSLISQLAHQFKPLFSGDERQLKFSNDTPYSRRGLSQYLWMNLAVRHLMASYSSAPLKDRATLLEVKQLFDDFTELAGEFKFLDPSIADTYMKRFRDANLFTLVSNGDSTLDIEEGTYYFAYVASISALSNKILVHMKEQCPALGTDPFGWPWHAIDCFRKEYFANSEKFWSPFPEMIKYYGNLKAKQKAELEKSIETGARRFGLNEDPIGSYDVDGFSGIVHYMESIFFRFDLNHDGVMELDEVMNAYPVFKLKIAEAAELDPIEDNKRLEAIFTYVVKYGKPPKKGFLGSAHFLWWSMRRPFWKIEAERDSLYKVLAIFTAQ